MKVRTVWFTEKWSSTLPQEKQRMGMIIMLMVGVVGVGVGEGGEWDCFWWWASGQG